MRESTKLCVLSQIKPQRRRPKKIGGVLKTQEGEEGRGACRMQLAGDPELLDLQVLC